MQNVNGSILMANHDLSDKSRLLEITKGNKYQVYDDFITDDKGQVVSVNGLDSRVFTTIEQGLLAPAPEFSQTFAQMVQKNKSQDYEAIIARMTANPEMIDLIHAQMGKQTEAAEVTDSLKRHIFYGTELDTVNIKEEIGDILFYCHLAASALGFTVQDCEDAVQRKLAKRFPEGFSNDNAINRDLEVERVELEKSVYADEFLKGMHSA